MGRIDGASATTFQVPDDHQPLLVKTMPSLSQNLDSLSGHRTEIGDGLEFKEADQSYRHRVLRGWPLRATPELLTTVHQYVVYRNLHQQMLRARVEMFGTGLLGALGCRGTATFTTSLQGFFDRNRMGALVRVG